MAKSKTVARTEEARQNPIGKSVPGATVVRVGVRGQFTHLYDPNLQLKEADGRVSKVGMTLCLSGFRRKKGCEGSRTQPDIYQSEASIVTCYRCLRLMQINLNRNGTYYGS